MIRSKGSIFIRAGLITGVVLFSFIFIGGSKAQDTSTQGPAQIAFIDTELVTIEETLENENATYNMEAFSLSVPLSVTSFYGVEAGTAFEIHLYLIFSIKSADASEGEAIACTFHNSQVVNAVGLIEINLTYAHLEACTQDESITYLPEGTYSGKILVAGPSNVVQKDFSLILKTQKGSSDPIPAQADVDVLKRLANNKEIAFKGTRYVLGVMDKGSISVWNAAGWVILLFSIVAILNLWTNIHFGGNQPGTENQSERSKAVQLRKIDRITIWVIVNILASAALIAFSQASKQTACTNDDEDHFAKCAVVAPIPIEEEAAKEIGETLPIVLTNEGTMQLKGEADRLDLTSSFSKTGEFSGTIPLAENDPDNKDTLTVKLSISDYWLYAFITIAVGVLIGYGVNQAYTLLLKNLQWRVDAEEIDEALEKTYKESKNKAYVKTYYDKVHEISNEIEIYKTNLSIYTEEEKKEELVALEKTANGLQSCWVSLGKVYEKLYPKETPQKTLKEYLEEQAVPLITKLNPLPLAQVPVFSQLSNYYPTENLEKNLPTDCTALDGTIQLAETMLESLETLNYLLIEKNINLDNPDLLIQLTKLILAKDSTEVKTSFNEALTLIIKFKEPKRELTAMEDLWERDEDRYQFLRVLASLVRREEPAASQEREETLEMAQRRLIVSQNIMTGISFLLAVASGMVVLYLNNPTWGSPLNYLTALLWGSTVSEGLKYTQDLVKKLK